MTTASNSGQFGNEKVDPSQFGGHQSEGGFGGEQSEGGYGGQQNEGGVSYNQGN